MTSHGSKFLPESQTIHATQVYTQWDVEAESSLIKAKGQSPVSLIACCIVMICKSTVRHLNIAPGKECDFAIQVLIVVGNFK